MKTKLQKMLTGLALLAFPIIAFSQTTVYNVNPTGDGIISDVAGLPEGGTNPWLDGNGIDGTTVLKVGASASTGAALTTNAIIPFQLPVRPVGKLVVSANLKVNIAYIRHWITSDIDLYGLPYNAASTMSPSDFYDGTYADPSGTVTSVQDAYIVRDVGGAEPTGVESFTDREVNSDGTGDAALVAYINAQYDAGAVAGDYVFLRLSVDATAGSVGAHYYGISDESTTEAPELMLEIEDAAVTPTTTFDINPTGDGIISDVAGLPEGGTNPWLDGNGIDGTTVLKVGASASTGAALTTNAIIPFELPVRPVGKLVVSANLKVNIAYIRHWISSDIDLYGLPYNAASTMSPSDFYDGTYADPSGTVTGIQDAYIVRDVGGAEPTGVESFTDREVDSSVGGDAALAAYINAQYDAGAVAGDYVFLRLSVDATAGSVGAHYYGISDESTAEAPVLSLEIENVLRVDSYEKSALGLYPNPVTDGRLRVSLDGFSNEARLDIYSLTGQLVHSEKIEASSRNSFETQLNLKSGLYIVKLQDGERGATQKLIVQ